MAEFSEQVNAAARNAAASGQWSDALDLIRTGLLEPLELERDEAEARASAAEKALTDTATELERRADVAEKQMSSGPATLECEEHKWQTRVRTFREAAQLLRDALRGGEE